MKKNLMAVIAFSVIFASSINVPTVAFADDNVTVDDIDYICSKMQVEEVNLDEIDGEFEITKSGAYELSGTLSGQIVIDAEKDGMLQLIFNGASINSENCAAINIIQCAEVIITTVEGTENTISDSGYYDDDDVDGVIFSKDDLFFNGDGILTINSSEHGIVSKDKLAIISGTINITSERKGISGKDEVDIYGGAITVNSRKVGIASTNSDNKKKGNVSISGGSITITSGKDAISAVNDIELSGGTIELNTDMEALHAGGELEVSGDVSIIVNGSAYQV